MDRPFKTSPSYVVVSVDNALRIAAMLQLEGALTLSEIARRLGVSPSTAHRLLSTLVYRDFAVQDVDRTYRVGPVLELAAHSQSAASRLRSLALPHLRRLVDVLHESANVAVRTDDTVRFIASVESEQALRVGNREGMVFPVEETTAGVLLLADLSSEELEMLFVRRDEKRRGGGPDLDALRKDLVRARRHGFALNQGRSERGVTAVGVPVRNGAGVSLAGLSVSMPSVRYEAARLPIIVNTLRAAAAQIESELEG